MNQSSLEPAGIVRPVSGGLAEIEREIGAEIEKLRLSKLKIGRLLLEARPLVPHGEWIPWVEARGLNRRSAERYMRLAKSDVAAGLPDEADLRYADISEEDAGEETTLPGELHGGADDRVEAAEAAAVYISWTFRLLVKHGDGLLDPALETVSDRRKKELAESCERLAEFLRTAATKIGRGG